MNACERGQALEGWVSAGGAERNECDKAVDIALIAVLPAMTLSANAVAVSERRSFALRMALIVGILVVVVSTIGVAYFTSERDRLRKAIWRELDSVADLKVRQLAEWRSERLQDARFLLETSAVGENVAELLQRPESEEARLAVIDWLQSIKGGDRYESILLIDRQLNVVVRIPDNAPAPRGPLRLALANSFVEGRLWLSDLHRPEATERPHLDLIAPVFAKPRNGRVGVIEEPPIAAVALRLAPERFIFPLLQRWPTLSVSAETVLVRREGDELVYLNDLRHEKNAALQLRRSINDPKLASAMAARGETGVREGVDYRGVPVLAAIRLVPDSPWRLIAKIDQSEAYQSIRNEAWTVAGFVGVVLAGMAGVAAYVWRVQNEQVLRRTLTVEKEARVLAERLALLSRYANDIIILADQSFRILEANECALSTYGYTLDEMRCMKLPDLRERALRKEFGKQFSSEQLRTGITFETIHQKKDGSTFPVQVVGRFVQLGGETYLLGVLRDITERKRSESAVRESEARFRNGIDTAPDAIFVQARGLFAYLNHAAVRLFGASNASELMNTPVLDRFIPEMRAAVQERIRRLNEDKRRVELAEERCLRLDGSVVDVEVSAVPFVFEGTVDGALVFARDVTDRKRAESALRESEERHRSLFENNHATMLLIDSMEGVIVDANPAASRFYGWSREELQRMRISQINLLSPEQLKAEIQLARETQRYHFFFKHRRADGSVRDVEVFSGPIITGNRSLLLSIVHDITDRKAAEAALRESEERLRLFVQYAPVPLAMLDRELRLVEVSRRWMTDYGIGERSVAGVSLYDVLPNASERWKEVHRRGLSGDVVVMEEDEYVRADGSVLLLRWEVRPWMDAGGAVCGIVIFSEDITQRKQAEAALAAQLEELRRWHAVTLGRETRVLELKAEVNRLLESMGRPAKYDSVLEKGAARAWSA